jgi:hypothetical protein
MAAAYHLDLAQVLVEVWKSGWLISPNFWSFCTSGFASVLDAYVQNKP